MRKILLLMPMFLLMLLCACGASEPAECNINESRTLDDTLVSDADAPFELDGSESIAEAPQEIAVPTMDQYTMACEEKAVSATNTQYITFRQNTETYSSPDESQELLTQSLTIPDFYSADVQLSMWVNEYIDNLHRTDVTYGQDLLDFAESDWKMDGEEEFYSYSHYVSMGVGRQDDAVLSLLCMNSTYSGGSHPNSIQTAHNLDLVQYRVLTMEDVVFEDRVNDLEMLVLNSVESKFSGIGESVLFEDYTETIHTALNYGNMTPYWYFNEEGMVVFFNPYTLGPYSSGVIRIQLTYEELTEILLPQYFPAGYWGRAKGVAVSDSPVQGTWVYYLDFAPGQTAYIQVDGRASHVQLSEVFWVDQTPIDESMLFSANHVDSSTTIAVTGDLMNTDKVYALEYSDETGGPYVIYIQGMKQIDELPKDEE